jgi:hypothetical protein
MVCVGVPPPQRGYGAKSTAVSGGQQRCLSLGRSDLDAQQPGGERKEMGDLYRNGYVNICVYIYRYDIRV